MVRVVADFSRAGESTRALGKRCDFLTEITGVGLLTASLAGVISFLSPCVLPLVSGYVSYVTGQFLFRSPGSQRLGEPRRNR